MPQAGVRCSAESLVDGLARRLRKVRSCRDSLAIGAGSATSAVNMATMSPDPFRALADSVLAFVDDWLGIVDGRTWIASSKAESECADETLADEWGEYPCRDAWISAHTAANAGLDHLRALAVLLSADGVVLALSTTARGALEAFAAAHHLVAPDIADARERVRRYMNMRLASLKDSLRQFPTGSSEPELRASREHVTNRIGRVTGSARRQGFNVRRTKRGVQYLDREPPSITRLCDAAVSDTPRLGALYYSQLSAVAHARPHGLTAHTRMVVPNADRATVSLPSASARGRPR